MTVIDTRQVEPLARFKGLRVSSVALSADGSLLLTGGDTGLLKSWDPLTGALRWKKKLARAALTRLAISPDRRWLAMTTRSPEVQLVSLASRKVAATLSGHRSPLHCLTFSPDSRTLLSGSLDNTAILWEVPA